jgi:hypothetical protein
MSKPQRQPARRCAVFRVPIFITAGHTVVTISGPRSKQAQRLSARLGLLATALKGLADEIRLLPPGSVRHEFDPHPAVKRARR